MKLYATSFAVLVGVTYGFLHAQDACAQTGSAVYKNNLPATLCIKVTGELYNGEVEEAGWGTAFFLNSNVEAITNSHVIPDPNLYKSMTIAGTLRERNDKSTEREVRLTLVARDIERDFAVLRADRPVPSPYVYIGNSRKVEPGERLIVIGCPIGFKQTLSDGVLGNTEDDPKGRWITNATINPGNSGGPVFAIGGNAVGIATGGIRNVPGQVPIVGINLVLPLHLAVDTILKTNKIKYVSSETPAGSSVPPPSPPSPVAAAATPPIFAKPVMAKAKNRVADVAAKTRAAANAKEFAAAELPRPLPASVAQAYEIRAVRAQPTGTNSPPGTQLFRFAATKGYKFESFTLHELSSQRVNPPRVRQTADGREIEVVVEFASQDSTAAAWWKGTLLTDQVRE